MKNFFYLSIILLSIASCGSKNKNHIEAFSTIVSADATVDSLSAVEIKTSSFTTAWGPETTQTLFENLSAPELSLLFTSFISQKDLDYLNCTNFNSLPIDHKKIFYIVFMAAIAERESSFDPEEETYDYKHKNTNIGLLQIDRESARRHAPEIVEIDITDENLKERNTNLLIGAFILKNQINGKWRPSIQGRLFPENSYYWEVLNYKYRGRVLESFNNNKFNLPFCKDRITGKQ